MKINFVCIWKCYNNVIMLMYNQIIQYLSTNDYEINTFCKDSYINIMTHLEEDYLNTVEFKKNKGVNIALLHGLAHKNYLNFSQNQKGLTEFDYFLTSGDRWRDYYLQCNVPDNKIKIIGSTKLDYLIQLQKSIKEDKNTIVFAPSHTNGISSYPLMLKYLKPLKEKYNILISPHPHDHDGEITTEALCKSNVVITDISSVMYEAMAMGKNVVCPNFLVEDMIFTYTPNSFEAEIYRNKINYHICNENNIETIIKKAMINKQSDSSFNYINGIVKKETYEKSGELIYKFLKTL